ncbi:MAG: aminopeptidase [Lentisphaeria bacterium]
MTVVKEKAKKKEAIGDWKREQGWDKLTLKEEAILEQYCQDYIAFLSHAKTERLAHDFFADLAEKHGFKNIAGVEPKQLKAGDKVYRSCAGKTMMLIKVGKQPISAGMNLVGAHIDSPRLDAKPFPLYEDSEIVLVDTHYYGGIKKYQWVAIPLAIHGVVIRQDGSTVDIHIGDEPSDPIFMVTDLLPHLDVEVGKKTMAEAFSGEDMNMLFGSRPVDKAKDDKNYKAKTKLRILQLLKERYNIVEEDFASAELEIVPAGQAREMGFDRSMIAGYGQDDRVCAYAAVRAILDDESIPERTMVSLVCDKEEIGSFGSTGMDSSFLENTIAELMEVTTGYSGLGLRRALENSRMISADVCALHDPDFPNASSPNNMCKVNCGIGITKYTGARGKSGASDANPEFLAQLRKIFNDAKVIWQACELGKVDCGGGGTISHYMARYGMDVVDCGVGLWCMHAPWEGAGKLDVYMAYKGYKAFLSH